MAAYAAANLATAAHRLPHPVMAARFVAGLPHGAYFGIASLVAASWSTPPAGAGRSAG